MDSAWIQELRHNTTTGSAHCAECPAYKDGRATKSTPGIGNPHGDLMMLTADPHYPNQATYHDWHAETTDSPTHTRPTGSGVSELKKLIAPIDDLTLNDIWLGSALKCPPAPNAHQQSRTEEFEYCKHYLEAEIQAVDPQLIVGYGADACLRALTTLDVARSHVPVTEECGRIFNTTPPLIVSPHWRYGWLDRPTRNRWGQGWRTNQRGLKAQYNCYRNAVQDAINSIRD